MECVLSFYVTEYYALISRSAVTASVRFDLYKSDRLFDLSESILGCLQVISRHPRK
jgi:hypothetical protein